MREEQKNTANIKSPSDELAKKRARSVSANKKKILRQRKIERIKALLFVFLTFYFAIILISSVIFFVKLTRGPEAVKKCGLAIQYTESSKLTYSADEVFIGGSLYIPYEGFSKLYPAVLTGNSNQITIILSSGNDYCTLYKDSRFIYIGNVQFALENPVLFLENDYYIPFEVFEKYINGLEISFDSRRGRYVISATEEPISFIGKFQELPEHIKVTDIP
ncbi:MAG: hypothetical protein IJN75_06155 [Clostridia bacterium]|nr:hypothetical protein [Clostridia bacterium]